MNSFQRSRFFMLFAGLSGAVAVALGAYAAHGLDGHAQELADKASRYQLYHALALLAAAFLQEKGRVWAGLAGAFFCLGSLLFPGALYALALFDLPWARLAPFGGTSFILGWLCLSVCAWRMKALA